MMPYIVIQLNKGMGEKTGVCISLFFHAFFLRVENEN